MGDDPDFATMTADQVASYLRAALAANSSANSVTLTLDRTTGEYWLIIA